MEACDSGIISALPCVAGGPTATMMSLAAPELLAATSE